MNCAGQLELNGTTNLFRDLKELSDLMPGMFTKDMDFYTISLVVRTIRVTL